MQLFYNRPEHSPTVAERVQVAITIPAGMFKAGNLDDFQVGFVYTQADQCLNLEAIAVNLYAVEAVLPKGVVAIAQVTKACPEEYVDEPAQSVVTSPAQRSNIVTSTTLKKA